MILQAAFTDSTPRYVKRNTEISALLLLPFFAIIITNGLFHHVVTNENAWRYMLMFAVVGLPIVALLLIGATFLRWLHDQQKAKQSLRHSLFDFKHSWMMLAVGGLALLLVAFMFGHDSVHCFIRNPAYLATHTHQTWQCASDGFLGGK